MASFKLFGNLEPLLDGNKEIELGAKDVRSAIGELIKLLPALVGELTDESGEFNRYYSVLVNGEMIEFLDDLDTKLTEKDEVTIFPPTAA